MNQPLLGPCRFERSSRHAAQPVNNLGEPEGDKAVLYRGMLIRIQLMQHGAAFIQDRLWPVVHQNERGIQESLVEEIVVNPLREIASIPNVPRHRIPGRFAPWWYATLNLEPLSETRHVVVGRNRRAVALVED